MIEITALDDSRVADYVHVGEPKWLVERGLFVAEGRLVVRRLFESPAFTIKSVLVTPSALTALEDVLDPARCPIYVCGQELMNQLAGFNFHRGCLAIAERPAVAEQNLRFQSSRLALALEGVGNPDNVGGLFRVAAAFGVDGVLLDGTSGDPLYRKAIRTSMGAVLKVRYARSRSWLETIAALKSSGADVIALTPNATAMSLRDYADKRRRDRPLVLMLGAEGPGLSVDALALATTAVRIPIAADVDSLNVVVAAGIALANLSDSLTLNASVASGE